MNLNETHKRMLEAGTFHIDGWTSKANHVAADELREAGYVKCFVHEAEQYTTINYTVTEDGRAALHRELEEE